MKLNLGAGNRYLNGYVNIDKSSKAKADLFMDLEQMPFDYLDETIEEINASHVLEHIKKIIPLMNECYRVLIKGGKMIIEVPQGIGTWADPTHVRAFSEISFRYYCGSNLSEFME